MAKIGMVGIGLMGHGIASNLVKHGHTLTVLEHPGNQPLDALKAAGATSCADGATLAAQSDVIILCVTGSPQVEAVLLSPAGVLEGLRPGTVIIDCSTAIPSSTVKVAEAVTEKGGRFLDAPMTRTPKEAAEGRLNLLGTHGMPMLMDHGFDATTSSLGIGLIGLVAIFSTLVLGRMSDQVERRNILAVIYLVRGLGFFALVMVGAHWELYAAATIGGIVWAGSIALSSAILADVYGVRLVGVLYGLTYLGHQIGGMISSWLGGWAFEAFHTHWVAFGAAGALLLLAAAISLQLPRRGALRAVPAMAAGGR